MLQLEERVKFLEQLKKNSPLRKNADLDAVGNAALYLLSDGSSCTTGEIIYVDGGYHIMGLPQIEHL